MDFHHIRHVCLLLMVCLALTHAEYPGGAESRNPQPISTNVNEIDDKIPEKPEPRQIGAVMPYTWIQPPQAVPAPAPVSSWSAALSPSWFSSSGQSLLSLLKPNVVGGRRSSLSSRLRNLMNALFYRRETSSPYLTSGSSYSYAFRPPPFGFNSGFGTSGLGSAISNQNLFGSASSYRPVVLPNYASAPSDAWSNYKQYGSSGQTPFSGTSNWNSGNTGSSSPSQSSAIWQSGSGSGSGSGSQYSGLSSSSYPSYSSGSGSSNGAYQASASNVYPNTSYQRSSVSSYSKPQTSVNTSVSSSVSSSSSSSSSSGTPSKSAAFQTK